MILKQAVISNFRGINDPRTIHFNGFNCIVGQNDAGKSTILRALDVFLNETKPTKADYNISGTDNLISIELRFDFQNAPLLLGEQIETTVEDEELVNEEGLVCIRKTWSVGESTIGNPKTSIFRKIYLGDNDIISRTETQLMALCRGNGIETVKGNGEEYNNVEKRQKLRNLFIRTGAEFEYNFDDIPTSGNSKIRSIGDAIKKALPDYQYFKADTSLSDTDNAIQKFFKDLAFKKIEDDINTEEVEEAIKTQLTEVLLKITEKINAVVREEERIEPFVEFDWSKLISTSFRSRTSGADIPLSSRGDGFRRLTMMSYFEYLAETNRPSLSHQIIFAFEEPETFLHPTTQELLFEKLKALTDNNYQVLISTHSPTIVGNTKTSDIIHITKPGNVYTIEQTNVHYKTIALDLGIKPDNIFSPLFSSSRLLFLVEGIDDVLAMNHLAESYKAAGEIDQTFDELGVSILPIGGCGGVKHWVNLDLFTKMGKEYFIFLDSDKKSPTEASPNENNLQRYGLRAGVDFLVSRKMLIENYMHPSAWARLIPGFSISFGDFDHAKNLYKSLSTDPLGRHIGGEKAVQKHFSSLTYNELKLSWYDGTTDEFLNIYNIIRGKLS